MLDTDENVYLRNEAVEFLTSIRERFGPDPELLFLVEEEWRLRGQVVWFGTDAMFDDAVNKGVLPREFLAWRVHARARRTGDTT